ncbi:hypothetical protein [Pyrobaculum aerophilum]|uniref:Uncharacterized protein n=2 Tax=Pyrobaculum aerophilum TaxID=13773 RepID=Q8ZT77_PYRAE|nr:MULTISPECIES: hypothetical protein [Pyrobaculum]AAL64886.1 hypothetical protein PAE3397 [Pyrobaculum aerophilum str. IM2]MCX8135453.1 hypothetical protein [Pyrobaculum aerophilum]HII47504.1 hypothetical protein [Pyrobaculum aerophilum]
MERYVRKYGDAVFINELLKNSEQHISTMQQFNASVYETLTKVVDSAEGYLKGEGRRLAEVVERLSTRVPEMEELGLREIRERLETLLRESEIVIEKLRARLEDVKEGRAAHLTLDELFDSVKELNDLWDTAMRLVNFYKRLYSDLSPLFLITA